MAEQKICVITGSTSGIGLEMAKQIARTGARVAVVGRTGAKAQQAREEVVTASGNNSVDAFTADLSSMKSVRQLADALCNKYERMDVLCNNAGAAYGSFEMTDEGLEATMATNHLSVFLLTNLLLPLLSKAEEPRIVITSSISHYTIKEPFSMDVFTKNLGYLGTKTYAISKACNAMFMHQLCDRLQGSHITVNCFHPGLVKTKIGNKHSNLLVALGWMAYAWSRGVSVQQGADTGTYLATSPEVKGLTNHYWDKRKHYKTSQLARNTKLQSELWHTSEALTGHRFSMA